ncbi:iron-siderophore ABC transporter substrate-binding protein [Paraliobacillus sediminis]|uniref:iron-siderophore ABC transporter substrate-binding protein n=1 Tax=Paraliobacillus sediminis TaxID=1885916 RepID=UPI001F073C62|nr:iron-siderophore ABC transporter substrate-binding protein [Paraliobacillus sediminis]
MNAKRKTSLTTLFIAAMSTILLFGCAAEESDSTETESASANTEETSEYPIVIEHAFGETVIESKPERVAAIQWGNHDVALDLGVVPVGLSAANFGVEDDSQLLPWTDEKFEELGEDEPNIYQDTDGLDFEAISDSNPDIILAAYSGITQEDYDILSEIAPVVAYQTDPWITTWREEVIYNATGMGMKEEGEQLIEDTENLIEEKANEYPEIEGVNVVFVAFTPGDLSELFVYTPADPRAGFLMELGMEYPESVLNAIEDPDAFYLTVSAENADMLNDADILVTYGDEEYKAIQEDPLLGKIPAIERDSVVFIGANTPLAAAGTPTPLSIAYTIDEYLELIGEAIEKTDE